MMGAKDDRRSTSTTSASSSRSLVVMMLLVMMYPMNTCAYHPSLSSPHAAHGYTHTHTLSKRCFFFFLFSSSRFSHPPHSRTEKKTYIN